MALSNIPGRTPLGACLRSPLGALTRIRSGVLVLVFCNESSLGVCHWDDSSYGLLELTGTPVTQPGWFYPDNDTLWDTSLASVEDNLANDNIFSYSIYNNMKAYYFRAGLMSFGPTPVLDGTGNAYGLTYCKPTSKDYPSWLYTTEHAVGGDYSTCNTSITLADLQDFFTNSMRGQEDRISHVEFVIDQTSSMVWATPTIVPPPNYESEQNIISSIYGAMPGFEAWVVSEGFDVHYSVLGQLTESEDWLDAVSRRAIVQHGRV